MGVPLRSMCGIQAGSFAKGKSVRAQFLNVKADGSFDGWNDWVIQWRGSPVKELGHVQVWRGGSVVLPMVTGIVTAYNDSVAPYPKFGVCKF